MQQILKLKNFIKFIVNTNIWIAFATLSFYELNYFQIRNELSLNSTPLFLFFSSWFVYNLFNIIGFKENEVSWAKTNFSLLKTITFSAFILLIVSFYFLDKKLIPFFAISSILSFFYATPFLKIGKNGFNLRKLWFLKSVIVALVWTISTVIVPLYENGFSYEFPTLMAIEKIFFILAITIPYDIKDLKADIEEKGMQTIVLKFGIKQSIVISNYFLFTAFVVAIYLNISNIIPVSIIYGLALFINFNLDETKSDYWYTFLVDGLIILYFLVVYLEHFLF